MSADLLELAPDEPTPQTLAFHSTSRYPSSEVSSIPAASSAGLLRSADAAIGGGGSVGFDAPAQPETGSAGPFSIRYYAPYFDVSTSQVRHRIQAAVLPRPRGAFFSMIEPNPDLYGPFWISTTLIFAMAMTGNLASFFSFTPDAASPEWHYDFSHLTSAGFFVWAYVVCCPLAVWALLKYQMDAPKRLADVACLYGYALSVFIPISVLCVLPSNALRWLLVGAGGLLSGLFLISNLQHHLADPLLAGPDTKRKQLAVAGGMAAAHVALIVLLKTFFFEYE